MQNPNPAPSDALVIFGITGDLAYKKIFPALEALEQRGRLPGIVVGVARGGTTREALIARMHESLAQHGDGTDAAAVARLAARLQLVDGDWMCRGFIASANDLLQPFTRTAAWEARMREVGHGQRSEMEAAEALAIARSSVPEPGRGVPAGDPSGLRMGQSVTVTPDDYGKDPVMGELLTLDHLRISVRRRDERAGEVVVHFPRLGYVVAAS